MKITRRGSWKDRGESSIELRNSKVSWNSSQKQLEITANNVGDFNTSATHDYTVSISLSELGQIMKELGVKASHDPANEVEANLSEAVSAIVKIVVSDLRSGR